MSTALSPRDERFFLLTLAGIQFSHILDFMIMMPLGPVLMKAFGIGTHEFGLLVASYSFSAAVSGILAATFVDLFERKRLLLIAFSLFALATLACGLAPSYSMLMVARGLAGVFGGIMGALVQTMIGDAIPYIRRARASGLVATAFSIATVAGVPLSLWLANQFSWRMPFMFIGALSVMFIGIGVRFLPELRHHLSDEKRAHLLSATFSVLGDANHLRALLFSALIIFSGFTIIPYITVYGVNNVGIPLHQIPIIYLVGRQARQGRGLSQGGPARHAALAGGDPCWRSAAVGLADLHYCLLCPDFRADDPGHGHHLLIGPTQTARHLHVIERHRPITGHGPCHHTGRLRYLTRRQRPHRRLPAGRLCRRRSEPDRRLVRLPHRHAWTKCVGQPSFFDDCGQPEKSAEKPKYETTPGRNDMPDDRQ